MTHAGEGRLQAYLDSEMSGADRVGLEVHLATCPTCVAELDELRLFGNDVRAALVSTDTVAVISTAFQTFRTRRLALDGAPAAANGRASHPSPQIRPTPIPAPQRTHRIGRSAAVSLLKAAALVVLLGSAAAAAIPGSPLARWVDRLIGGATPEVPAVQAPPPAISPPVEPQELAASEPDAAAYLAPFNGEVHIRLRSLGENARIHVRLTAEAQAAIRPVERRADIASNSGSGWIEVWNLGEADVFVDLPRNVEQATVEVDGRVFYAKHGEETTTPGPVVQREPGAIIFRTRF